MENADQPTAPPAEHGRRKLKRRRWLRRLGFVFLVLLIVGGIGRMMMPSAVRWYVNRTLDRSPLYDGVVGDVDIYLWRGAYAIKDVKLIKTTGNVPVPLFAAKRVDLSIEWGALVHGSIVGRVELDQPELNFVDAEDKANSQTGGALDSGNANQGDSAGAAGAPWLGMIRDLFPFRINSVRVNDGSVHLRTYSGDVPVDVFISQLQAQVDNLTNIRDEVKPLITTVTADGLAMDHARFEYQMKLDPFSYYPTFTLVVAAAGPGCDADPRPDPALWRLRLRARVVRPGRRARGDRGTARRVREAVVP